MKYNQRVECIGNIGPVKAGTRGTYIGIRSSNGYAVIAWDGLTMGHNGNDGVPNSMRSDNRRDIWYIDDYSFKMIDNEVIVEML